MRHGACGGEGARSAGRAADAAARGAGGLSGAERVAGAALDPGGPPGRVTAPSRAGDIVLWAEDVRVDYMGEAPTHAVRGVSFTLRRGEILGVAGESGCGKSTLAYAVTHLLRPPARLVGGTVRYWDTARGELVDIMRMAPEELRRWRWEKVSMVFQSAMNALNPVTSLRRQFGDVLRAHIDGIGSAEVEARADDIMGRERYATLAGAPGESPPTDGRSRPPSCSPR